MKIFCLVFISLCFVPFIKARGVNGGMSCAVCTVLTGVVMQVAEIHEEGFFNATKRICNILPNRIQNTCLKTVDDIQPYLTNASLKLTPDVFCLIYGTCKTDSNGNLCHLFPLNLEKNEIRFLEKTENKLDLPKIDVCELPYIKDICKILNNSYTSLNPVEDYDKDGFSAMAAGRGSDWRGKDCADNNKDFYPGRRPLNYDYFADSNCNGIWGPDNTSLTFKSWEESLCKKSEPRGLIYIGDSIGAHFHMPEVWINPILFTLPGLNASDVILDEIDWPQFGFATGHKNITKNILIQGLTDSLYLRLRKRNRCNHRDYQNLSQNGASSYEALSHADSFFRNQSRDHPAIVLFAMLGNDVCNNFNDTLNMTTPAHVFRKNVMKALLLLDTKLAKNSHVVLIELVEAQFIYPAMANRLHPIGLLHNNVYYKDLYNWFNCLQIGPCTGWLNSDEELRNATTKRARKLNRVLRRIVQEETFQHFDLHYIKNPITYMVKTKKVNVSELLEKVDSLHPNQKAQVLLADVVWHFLEKLPSNVLGPINPYNDEIIKLFGEQGGH